MCCATTASTPPHSWPGPWPRRTARRSGRWLWWAGSSTGSPPRRSEPGSAGHAYGQMLDAVDEVGPDIAHLAGQREPVDAGQQLLEHDAQLQPGQVAAETVVWTALAESQVVVGLAGHVEGVRAVEDRLVAVARGVPHDDLVAGPDRRVVQPDVAGRRTPEMVDR